MPALHAITTQKLHLLEAKHERRIVRIVEPCEGAVVSVDGTHYISFSSNDYLGLSRDKRVIDAATNALAKYGAGAGASRLITGNNPLYDELETVLAAMHGTEAACVFGSGYTANIGVITALVAKADMIVADKLIHASMIDGAKLSGATLYRFAHNNLNHCREILQSHRAEHANCLILTEAIFSMDGDCAPLTELRTLTDKYDGWLMVDGAHSLSEFGVQSSECSKQHSIDNSTTPVTRHLNPELQTLHSELYIGTLSKAAGSYGGYVCAAQPVIDYIKTAARSLIYSTALPPATLAASIAALTIMRDEPELCVIPLQRAQQFTALLGLPEAQSPIVPLVIGESQAALAAADTLKKRGFWVQAIRPPTVPPGSARLRIAFSALHSEKQVEQLAQAVKEMVLCA